MRFEYPEYLLLLAVVAIAFFWRMRYYRRLFVQYPQAASLRQLEDRKTKFLSRFVSILRTLLLALIVLALAQPQSVEYNRRNHTEGVDILLLLDVSQSMSAEDLAPNRLTVAKQTLEKFVKKRSSDRVGLVIFGGDAFTRSPLTIDHDIVTRFLGDVTLNSAGNGTAIGQAIAVGLNRLKKSDVKNKLIILLTDGENNAGQVDPQTASKMAKSLGVKVYVIGVGKEGGAPIPYPDQRFGKQYYRYPDGSLQLTKLDEVGLKEIAAITGGKYFRATNTNALEDIYDKIDLLEKSKIDTTNYERLSELFPFLLKLIFIGLLLEFIIAAFFLGAIP